MRNDDVMAQVRAANPISEAALSRTNRGAIDGLREGIIMTDQETIPAGAARERPDPATGVSSVRVSAVRHARKRSSRQILLTAAVGVAATLALVMAPTLDLRGDSRPPATADAAQVLMQAGAAAGAQPGGSANAAYWHSVSEYQRLDNRGDQRLTDHQREIWIGHSQSGVLKDDGVSPGVIGLGVAMFSAGTSGFTLDGLFALPTEPKALERDLRAGINGAGQGDDDEMFAMVGDLLRESPAPPALRKALWEVAAQIPGVTLVGAVTDSAGRSGVAVERAGRRYILDPHDGRLLEEIAGDFHSTYLDQGPAATAPALPPLPKRCTTWAFC
jgi:hypothetical protein